MYNTASICPPLPHFAAPKTNMWAARHFYEAEANPCRRDLLPTPPIRSLKGYKYSLPRRDVEVCGHFQSTGVLTHKTKIWNFITFKTLNPTHNSMNLIHTATCYASEDAVQIRKWVLLQFHTSWLQSLITLLHIYTGYNPYTPIFHSVRSVWYSLGDCWPLTAWLLQLFSR
jgi:hypothetical protein